MLYPIGIQSFPSIREEDYVYVDKTAYVYQMASRGKYYFLSRPRRFGKSLLVSTLEAYFLGKRELFKGLAIENLEKEWTSFPVLRLDLNAEKFEQPEELENRINVYLTKWETAYGAASEEMSLSARFAGVVERAYEKTGKKVVILIDEYDKPLLEAIGNDKLREAYRSTLSAFFTVMKNQADYIRFVFLTGVTKFTKVSIFSGLNNLRDISTSAQFAGVCGITEGELRDYFGESVTTLAASNGLTVGECYAKLQQMYDGYHFNGNSEGVYNPYSLLNTFESGSFGYYWFESGTPTFLTKIIQDTDYDLTKIQEAEVTLDVLDNATGQDLSPVPVLYQAGYLTISGYDPEYELYSLKFPNREVELGFMRYLLPTFIRKSDTLERSFIKSFVKAVNAGDPDTFMGQLQTMFAGNSDKVAGDKEIYFQNVMYVTFRLMGFYAQVEGDTSNGRIDLTIETPGYIYIVKIKLDGSADEALSQINEKKYAAPFAHDPRHLFKIGVNFSSETRGVSEWKIE